VLHTYNPDNVIVTLAARRITGFARGTFIEVNWAEARTSTRVGIGGETTRSILNNLTATVNLTLEYSSPSHEFLSQLLKIQQLTAGDVGRLSIIDMNNINQTKFAAPEAWVQAPPNYAYETEANSWQWTIATGPVDHKAFGLTVAVAIG
jgi:hypothetical protein